MPTVSLISVLNEQCISQDGQTALHLASNSHHTDVVKLLVDSGAQIDNKDKVSILNHVWWFIVIVLSLSTSPPSTLFLPLTSLFLFHYSVNSMRLELAGLHFN